MTNEIDLKWNSRHNEVMAGMNAMLGNMDKMASKVDTIGKKQDAANKKNTSAWSKMQGQIKQSVLGLTGFTSGLGAIYGISQAIAGEFQKIYETAKKAADINIRGGQSFAPMNVNMMLDKEGSGGVSDENEFNRLKSRMKKDVFLQEEEMNQVYSNALSARGDLNVNEMNDFIRTAGRLLPGNVEAIETLAARGMDISKVTGEKDATKVISSILEMQAASRAVKVDDLAANVMTPILAIMKKGGSFEEAAEFFAGLTQLTGDVTPEKSRTGSIAMLREMYEFVPERKMEDRRGNTVRISKQAIQDYEKALTEGPMQAAQVIRNNPQLAEAFLKHAGSMGKGALLPAFEAFFTGDEKAMEQMRAAQQKIGAMGNANAIAGYQDRLRRNASNEQLQIFKADKSMKIFEEDWAYSRHGVREAQRSMYMQVAEDVINRTDSVGFDSLSDWNDRANLRWQASGGDPADAATMSILRQANSSKNRSDPKYTEDVIAPALDTVRMMENTLFAPPKGRGQKPGGGRR
ncbi:MAG: hypothetical protein HUJ26_18710 [Planctomycetaceae bacterium]|nr:hypothetical protein [Planctomycetaceae bacterium]